jgi:hypothetical protein
MLTAIFCGCWKYNLKRLTILNKMNNTPLQNKKICTMNLFPNDMYSNQSIPLPSPVSQFNPRIDNPLEKFFIFGLSYLLKFNNNRGLYNTKIDSKVYLGMPFYEFTMLTKDLLFKNDRHLIKTDIVNLLKSVVPQQFRQSFQNKYISDPFWLCDKCSEWMSFGLIDWLVGPVEKINITFTMNNNNNNNNNNNDNSINMRPSSSSTEILQITDLERAIISNWTSVIKLTECRYLSESKCKAACLYICKTPTQEFFTNEVGLPLYMKPNFTDNSCLMFFGTQPLPQDMDPIYKEACFSDCNSRPTLCV